jgi:chromosome segregation ATPase
MAIPATTKTQLETLEKKIDSHMNHSSQSDERMARIENKLDQLAEAVISIARAEEKIAVLIQDTRDIKLSLNTGADRMQRIELQTINNTSDLKTLNKFFWLIATATITVAITAIAVSTGAL